jgi:hypothetical protein
MKSSSGSDVFPQNGELLALLENMKDPEFMVEFQRFMGHLSDVEEKAAMDDLDNLEKLGINDTVALPTSHGLSATQRRDGATLTTSALKFLDRYSSTKERKSINEGAYQEYLRLFMMGILNGSPMSKEEFARTLSSNTFGITETTLCSFCGEKGTKQCARCHSATYCSRKCQVAHHKIHKPSCKSPECNSK